MRYNDSSTDVWELNDGESVQVDLTIPASTTISLWEQDLFMKDGDDDFLGEAKLQGHGGRVEFKNPSKGDHLYTLSYETEN